MPTDYNAIAKHNRGYYGSGISSFGPKLLARLYDKRTHFVFELLQNAEDAIRRRSGLGPRSVQFELTRDGLLVSHFGEHFNSADIRGICGIDESTKEDDITAIGHFGIGFKSVFAFTDRPEIWSGDEAFAIESFVLPVPIGPRDREPEQTVFWLPFGQGKEDAFDEIAERLRDLSARTLLFLREISDVSWRVEGAGQGSYSRESESVNHSTRRILLQERLDDQQALEEFWLVCSRAAAHGDREIGAVEFAFQLDRDENGVESVVPTDDSRLHVFFQTNVAARLGFLLHGPFRTTPARDNVPPGDPWNMYLIEEASSLLGVSLEELRSMGLLSIRALATLPLVREDFAGTMFFPMFEATRSIFAERSLLPTNGATRVSADRAILARGQDLRELVSSKQLSDLYGSEKRLSWLSDEITIYLAATLRGYLMKEHGVREVVPESFISRIDKGFLEAQSPDWIRRLYRFLNGQKRLVEATANRGKPWVRLEDGSHVAAYDGYQPRAFLPSKHGKSGFPTVDVQVCRGEDAREFLKSLKLTEPDPVDAVIKNVLPRYESPIGIQNLDQYRNDLGSIASAYGTQRVDQRIKLVSALRRCKWVLSRAHSHERGWNHASECYLPTDRLTQLFEDVPNIRFVDGSVAGLQGEAIRDVLIACGSARYLETIPSIDQLSDDARKALRLAYGDDRISSTYSPDDRSLRGLKALLAHVGSISAEEAAPRVALLWKALGDLVQDKRGSVVKGTYAWFYYSRREMSHDAEFIRRLKGVNWIPQGDKLVKPSESIFEHIDPLWQPNAVLQTALGFRPPLIDMLAKEIGIDRDFVMAMANADPYVRQQALNLLRGSSPKSDGLAGPMTTSTTGSDQQSTGVEETQRNSVDESDPRTDRAISSGRSTGADGGHGGSKGGSDNRGPIGVSQAGHRPFISYVSASLSDDSEEDVSDSATQEERMRVEAEAIDHILSLESELHRTPACNPGFDLYGADSSGNTIKWVEVKAMVGSLDNHAVGMSRKQFETAQEKGSRYWLYVVEQARSDQPRILRIQDPAGNARSFTFDRGWRDIAQLTQVNITTGEIIEERNDVIVK